MYGYSHPRNIREKELPYVLRKDKQPKRYKNFTAKQREELAAEMRGAMLKRASIHGGHFGPDFGIVDKIIAELIQAHRARNT